MNRILVSDQSVNSYDFSVLTAGIDLSRFEANPIMLFNHKRATSGKTDDVLPIGTWKDLSIEGDKMYATPVFDETDPFALRIKNKFDAKVLRAASIGIRIKDMALDKENDTLQVLAAQLVEISLVDIPSNQNAVAVYDDNDERMEEGEVLALMASASPPSPTKNSVSMNYKKSLGLLGLTADASDEALAAKITALQAQADENENLRAQVASYEAQEQERQAAAVTTLVDDAIAAKKITPDQRAAYIKLATADYESATSVLSAMSTVTRLSEIPGASKSSQTKVEGKTFAELRKENPQILMELKENDPEKYAELYAAYQAH